jgi:hypothetical protein
MRWPQRVRDEGIELVDLGDPTGPLGAIAPVPTREKLTLLEKPAVA